jgi:ribonuclease-3 family protein
VLFSRAISITQAKQLSPIFLAYLGDAVYELYIRDRHLLPPKKIAQYHHQVVEHVRAEAQAIQLRSLEKHLTPEEQEITRRGRNAISSKPKRLDQATYQQATAFEALLGYLYLTNPERLTELLALLMFDEA